MRKPRRITVVAVGLAISLATLAFVFRPYDRAKLAPPSGASWTRIDDVSPHLVDALIAAEDARFYSHHGVDLAGIGRAMWLTGRGRGVHGGSTITMQTVKMIEPQRRTLRRYVRNQVLAVRLERTATKREILEQYVNRIYFANGVVGVRDAADRYFGKTPADLTLADASLLAGMAKAPSAFNPETQTARAIARRDQVLGLVAARGFASEADVALARLEPYTPR